jgi:hypothetical protein
MNRILLSLGLSVILGLLSCTPKPKAAMENSGAITSESAKSIALKYLHTIKDAREFLPESTTVSTWAVDSNFWSVFIMKSNQEIPPVYLISVHKTTGKAKLEPLE